MIRAQRITSDNIDSLQAVYERFMQRAATDYQWNFPPLPFPQLKVAILQNALAGYRMEDTSVEDTVGFMLYCHEAHRAIEINVIYSELEDKKTVLDKLLVPFIQEIRQTEGWDVISYAMLGEQEHFIRSICWYGFRPVGQAIVDFDIMDSISLQIAHQQQLAHLPEDITLVPWQSQYAGGVAEVIYEAFSKASDALWDPRFGSLKGTRQVLGLIESGRMGALLREYTTVALRGDQPVGVCLLVHADGYNANIPLIGVHPDYKKISLGLHLLQTTLKQVVQGMLEAKISLLKISATLDTDNIPAIKMYRRLGFREVSNYPHVYMTREKALAYQPGKWC
jgi:ribosomal protein S18 acetylase RimI-like enzyme